MNNAEVGEIYIPSKSCVEWIVPKSTLVSLLPGRDGQCLQSPYFTYCNRPVQMRFKCKKPMIILPEQHAPYFQLETQQDITFQAPTGYSSYARGIGIFPRFSTTPTSHLAIRIRGIKGTDGSSDVVFNDVDRLDSALNLGMDTDSRVIGWISLVELLAVLIKDKDVIFFIDCDKEIALEYNNSPLPVKKAKISTTCISTLHDEYKTESRPTCGASHDSISSPRPHKARSREIHQAYHDSVNPPSLQEPERGVEIDPSDELVPTTQLQQNPPREGDIFLKNLEKSFIKEEYCDITIQVEDHLFRSHKLILSARSPVLKEMMTEDMLEKHCGMVKVTDCKPKIFQKFLLYLYSGKVEDISEGTALELYKIADEYKVDNLKTICINYMKTNLSVGMFTNVIKLASIHDEAELLKTATEYFMTNAKIIISHPSWEIFTKENFEGAQELYLLAL